MSTQTTQTSTFTVRDLFNRFVRQEFNDRLNLMEAIYPTFLANKPSFPADYTCEDAITEAEKKGWLIDRPGEGISISMYVWKEIEKTESPENHVDVLMLLAKELQEKCAHSFKPNSQIRLQESRVENVWLETNAIHAIVDGRLLYPKLVQFKCERCSQTKSYAYCLYCPFCFSIITTVLKTLEKSDFSTYFQELGMINQDKLEIWGCMGCDAGFIRPLSR